MTVADGKIDFEYKQDVQDLIGTHLTQNEGVDINLEGCDVKFNIRDIADVDNFFSINCSPGGWYNGVYYEAEQGGCTVIVGNEHLAIAAEYRGEFVVSSAEVILFRIPYNNDYFVMMVYPEV
jgi:hypothetical protein